MVTSAFLTIYCDLIRQSEEIDCIFALTQFTVKSITCKKLFERTSQPEHLSVDICDNKTKEKYKFFIEHNGLSQFSTDVQVRSSSSSMPATSVQLVQQKIIWTTDLEIPLLAFNCSDTLKTSTFLPCCPLSTKSSQYFLNERFALGSTQLLHSTTSSLVSNSMAEDWILGEGGFLNKILGTSCIK